MSERINKLNNLSVDIINGLPGSFFVIDNDTRNLIRWNKNFEKITGYAAEELSEMTPLDFATPDEKKLTAKTIEKIIKTGKASGEQFLVTKSGKKIPHYFSHTRLKRGPKTYGVGMGLDITKQREAMETVKRERTVSDAIISGLPGTFFVIDLKTFKIVRWSSNFEKVGGYTKKEILNMSPEDVVVKKDRQKIREALKKVIKEGKANLEVCTLTKDGKKIPNYISAALFSEEGHQYIAGIGINISERKKAEKALMQSEEKFRTMFDTMTQGVVYIDSHGRITSVNGAAEKIYGISFAEAKGKTVVKLNIIAIHEDGSNFPVEARPLQVALRTGTQIKNIVMAVFNKIEKQFRWVNVTAIPKFRPGEDKPFQVYGIAEDITEQKEAERKQAKLSAVIETTPDFAGLADENATAIYINKAGRKMAGISEKEDITKYKIPDFHPKWAAEKIQKEGMPVAIKKGCWTGETAILDREGKITPVLQVILSHKNPDGSIAYFSTVAHDISERKKSEEKLRESEEKYRMFVNTSPDTVITTDMKAKITFASQRTLDYFGYKPEELLEMNSFDLIVPEEREKAFKAFQNTVKKGFVRNAEFTLLKKDSSKFIAEINATIIKDVGGKPKTLISTMRDITERKRVEEILKNLATRFASMYGPQFFNQVSAHVCEVLGADYAFVGKLIPSQHRVKIIGGFGIGKPLEPMEFDLDYTPCQEVIGKETCVYPSKAQKLFPKDKLLKEMGAEGYAGIPLYTRDGKPLGIFVVISKKPISDKKLAISMMTGYSERVSAEIERSEAEEALRVSEEKYSSLVERSNDGIVIIQDQELRFVNTMMTKLTGFSKQEATGKPFVDFIAPGYRKIVVERYKSRMAGKEVPSKYEIEIITKKGALVPVELSMSVIEYEGKPANMALMRDITERKRTEDALRTSENKFRQFFENEPAYAYMVSPKGVIIDINKAALKAFGYDKKELVGKPIEAMYAPESVPKMKQIFNKWKETGKVENEELTVKTKKGKRRTVLLNVDAVKDTEGKIVHSISLQNDITERKRAEEAYRESKERTTDILESITDAFFALDKNWHFTYMTKRAEELLERNREELLGKNIWDEFPEAVGSTFYNEYHKAIKERVPVSFEEYYPPLKTWYEVHAFPYKDGLSVYFNDINERKEAEEALKQKDLDIRRAYVDVLSAVTGGKLILMSQDEIENALGKPVTKALKATSFEQLAEIRKQVRKNFGEKFPNLEKKGDMLLAAGEALTNSIKHAHGGSLRMYKKNQLMQILIEDKGPGIDFSQLPKATLLSGFSTAKSLGVGFDVMLEFSDRVLLFTEPGKTIIVLEKFAEEKEKQIAV